MKSMNMITMKRIVARSLTDTSTIRSSSLSFLRSLSSTSTTTVDVDAAASSVAKLVTPTFLQPRVVLYDGVCHLCHRAQMKSMNMITMKRIVARSLTDTSTIRSSSLSFLRSLSSTSTTTVDVDAAASSVAKLVTPTFLQPRVVLYDGVCHLCHRGVKWVIRADKDRKIKFCCVQSNAAKPYLRASGLEREDVLRRFLFIEGLNVYSQGSTAALHVLSYLPLPYSALSWLWVIPTPIRDAVYDYIAKNRYKWFGKADDCLVLQEKELLERFIDRDEMMKRDS